MKQTTTPSLRTSNWGTSGDYAYGGLSVPAQGPLCAGESCWRDPAGTAEKAEIQVVDANGKFLFSKPLPPRNGILELPQLTPGLNIATLLCDGIRIGVVKLSIVK